MCEANGTGRLGWEGKQTLGIGKAAHGCSVRDLLTPEFFQHRLNYFKKLMDKK